MLNVFCDRPRELLSSVCNAIREGEHAEWELHADGRLRYVGRSGRLRDAAKLEPRRYEHGITFRYCGIRAERKLRGEVLLRAKLHGRMLELLAGSFLGAYTSVVFEPQPLRG